MTSIGKVSQGLPGIDELAQAECPSAVLGKNGPRCELGQVGRHIAGRCDRAVHDRLVDSIDPSRNRHALCAGLDLDMTVSSDKPTRNRTDGFLGHLDREDVHLGQGSAKQQCLAQITAGALDAADRVG